MADEKKSTPAKTESKGTSESASSTPKVAENGKGDAPRNCFSDQYRSNFDGIDWSR